MNDFYNTLILATENCNMLVAYLSKIVLIFEHLYINEEARCVKSSLHSAKFLLIVLLNLTKNGVKIVVNKASQYIQNHFSWDKI